MRSAGGSGGGIGLPKRKLDAMAGIRGQSGVLNDKERMRKMRAQLELAESLAVVKHVEVEAKRAKKGAAESGLFDSAPGAVVKLRRRSRIELRLAPPYSAGVDAPGRPRAHLRPRME